ncbi:DUF92 domain-containing protein [Thermomicrobium sp. 4228-Ro]|uniref:DUF92 domain-containing protein n=1 Tax=Thermomicrobium sp. 4228-Ro TaxID=2993937 RepID=UPI0022487E57|nr:DUF92 domain-containing protein [Thermomicrobium sp. 4228-Ro]MCX2728439.1 DUF92 domain-containing protein [Thermomicrobium sp. 4228-Ro]
MSAHPAGPALRLLTGTLLATPIAYLGYQRSALDRGGALAAAAVGALVYAGGGFAWSLPMIGFFASASILTRIRSVRQRAGHTAGSEETARTARQVAANGGVAALLGLLEFCTPRPAWTAPYLGAVAAAAADTWATEIGGLSPGLPRSLRTGRPVPHGTSGAVTPLGTAAMVAGAGLVALLAPRTVPRWVVLLAGCTGAVVDTLLGATVQARYRCACCSRIVEDPRHDCPGRVQRESGLPGVTNDTVNVLATLCAAGAAAALARLNRRAG